jgi:hypothetical protein
MEVALKQHAWAAVATLVMTLAPGAVLAGSAFGSGSIVAYNEGSATLSVSSSALAVEKLQILAGTSYRFIGCPDLYPAGSACRTVAQKWDLGLFQNQPPEYFRKLLVDLSENSCRVEYERSDVADTSGAYGAISLRPIP